MTSKQRSAARPSPRVAAAGVAAAAGLILAGCGGGGNSSSAPTATSSGPAAPTASASSAGGQGITVTVDEVEFKLNLSTTTFKPGTYTFVAKNAGQVTHALQIEGPGVEDRKTGNVSPGGSAMLTVTLQKGSYELSCPVDGHKGLGMDTHITVA
jgi:uncharacterized cupredoxin-like copper-binding protein